MMDEDQILENNIKYEYLNAPCLLEDFKNNYLASLNIFLNDQKFKEKTDALPALKSSAISKYEKLILKEQADLLKSKTKNKFSNKLQPLSLEYDPNQIHKMNKTTPNIKKKQTSKGIPIRYIIIDHELVEISLEAIEESNEINNKLTDPFNAYFHEDNPKIRKKALEQIINNIMPKKNEDEDEDSKGNNDKSSKIKRSISNVKNNTNYGYNGNNTETNSFRQHKAKSNILYKDLEVLQMKYKNYDLEQKRKEEKYGPILKQFRDNCNNHNIITLDQKIDYFVYLYKNNMLKPKKKGSIIIQKSISKKNNKKVQKMVTPSSKNTVNYNAQKSPISFSYNNLFENHIKYINELKNNFKIIDDYLNISQLEAFERNLDTKIKSFHIMKPNFENSDKFIDKLRMYLRCLEVTPEKIILRKEYLLY
jgi:hypothetical protein